MCKTGNGWVMAVWLRHTQTRNEGEREKRGCGRKERERKKIKERVSLKMHEI